MSSRISKSHRQREFAIVKTCGRWSVLRVVRVGGEGVRGGGTENLARDNREELSRASGRTRQKSQ